MLKKSPILFALAVFVLGVGWPITSVQAHCVDPPGVHSGGHPHCRNDEGGPTNKARYDVTMTGDLEFSDSFYVGRDGGGRSKPVNVSFQLINMDLDNFFFDQFDGQNSTNCFKDAPVVGNTIAITISQEKDESAYLQYWFTGHDEEGLAGGTEIQYLLEMFDEVGFLGDWRPATDDTTTATFTSWEMSINGNNELACTGGDFLVIGVTIGVKNTTP